MAILNKDNIKDIKEVLTTNVHFNDKCIDITIKCWLNYGIYEEFTVARIYDQYAVTYINGKEKEYKRRKPALNAILKAYNTLDKIDDILSFKAIEIVEDDINNKSLNDIIKEDIKEYYTVGNMYFNSYNEAVEYCVKSDFDPELMITKRGTNSTLKNNRIKIKLLDNKINRLLDKRMDIRDEIIKQGIKFNDDDNALIKQLNELDKQMDSLEFKIDEIKEENKVIHSNIFKGNLNSLYKEYNNYKYKVIDNNKGFEIFTNNIKDYLYNNNYTIKLILDNKEVFKQGYKINAIGANWLDKDTFQVLSYKKNDTINTVEKVEAYSNNILICKTVWRNRGNNFLSYVYTKGFRENIFFNAKSITIDSIENAKRIFKNDKEVMEILNNYKVA